MTKQSVCSYKLKPTIGKQKFYLCYLTVKKLVDGRVALSRLTRFSCLCLKSFCTCSRKHFRNLWCLTKLSLCESYSLRFWRRADIT